MSPGTQELVGGEGVGSRGHEHAGHLEVKGWGSSVSESADGGNRSARELQGALMIEHRVSPTEQGVVAQASGVSWGHLGMGAPKDWGHLRPERGR